MEKKQGSGPKKEGTGKESGGNKGARESDLKLGPCDKAHVTEQVRLQDEDEPCDDGVR